METQVNKLIVMEFQRGVTKLLENGVFLEFMLLPCSGSDLDIGLSIKPEVSGEMESNTIKELLAQSKVSPHMVLIRSKTDLIRAPIDN